jgi:hypothetical protein
VIAMTNSRAGRLLIAVAGIAMALTAAMPSTSNAAIDKAKSHRPADGKWKFYNGGAGARKGTLTVSDHGRRAEDLSIIPPSFCGKGRRLTVLGAKPIRKGGPGGGTEWYVGATKNTVLQVKFTQGTTKGDAQLTVYFLNNEGEAFVTLDVPGCGDLNWALSAPKHNK